MIEQFLQFLLRKWQNRQSLKTLGGIRSSKWPSVRKTFLETHSNCALCGGNKTIEVHHKQPFHLHPELELDPNNLISLCEAGTNGIVCHRAFGHLGNYQSVNVDVENDVRVWAEKIKNRP